MKEKYHHEMDPRWGAFYPDDLTFEQFQKIALPRLGLIALCDEEVRKRYRVLHKLMAFSYYEYEFYDTAAAQMSAIMEMALAIKYRLVTGEIWHSKEKGIKPARNLKSLLAWAQKQNLLEFDHQHQLDLLRNSRNYYAHPMRHSFGGGINRSRIEELIIMINDLFDPTFEQQKILVKQFENWLMTNQESRLMLMTSDKTIPLCAVELISIKRDGDYLIGCFPCIDLNSIDKESPFSVPTMITLKMSKPELNPVSIGGVDSLSNNEVQILRASEEIKIYLRKWEDDLSKMENLATEILMWRTTELTSAITQARIDYFNNYPS